MGLIWFVTSFGPPEAFPSPGSYCFLKSRVQSRLEKEKEKSLSKPLAVQAPEDDLVGLEESYKQQPISQ